MTVRRNCLKPTSPICLNGIGRSNVPARREQDAGFAARPCFDDERFSAAGALFYNCLMTFNHTIWDNLAFAFMDSLYANPKLRMASLWRLLLYPFCGRATGVDHVRFNLCRSRRFLISGGRRLCARLRTSLRGSASCMSLSSVSASPWRLASISSTRSFTPKNSKRRFGFNEVTS